MTYCDFLLGALLEHSRKILFVYFGIIGMKLAEHLSLRSSTLKELLDRFIKELGSMRSIKWC